MTERPTERISVILRREAVQSRWADHVWDLHGVVPDVGGTTRTVHEDGHTLLRVFPGFELVLFRDEAEGYYLNASTEVPSVFVSLRIDEASGEPYPFLATLSYNEAARWMDSNERVERTNPTSRRSCAKASIRRCGSRRCARFSATRAST